MLNAQNVASTAWAFATVNYRDGKPFAALTRGAERRALDEKLFAALEIAAEWQPSYFNPQDAANTTWAFATVNAGM